jgi:protocatechuate 3,4-dioxygenase beta subunit
MTDEDNDHGVRRREALGLIGGLGLGGAFGGAVALRKFTSDSEEAEAASCVLTPEVTEGPYWVENSLTRRDIREDRPGLPLEVVFSVQNARTCKPIPGADVEIWHCDARGEYSGVSDSERFLRGHQQANAAGKATFLTVYPGWYRGRTPHIHLKVHVGGEVVHTGQVFFNERITARVYRQAPYTANGQADTSHAQDMIYAQAGRRRAELKLATHTSGMSGYRGSITLGVAA